MSDTNTYEGRVRVTGMPFHSDGEVIKKVVVTLLGSSAKLAVWSPERRLFQEVDYLDDVKITDIRGGNIEFSGRSRQLRDEVGTADSDQQATWDLTPAVCTSCR